MVIKIKNPRSEGEKKLDRLLEKLEQKNIITKAEKESVKNGK